MTEFEKMIMEELRSMKSEFKDDINILHAKIDKGNDKLDVTRDGLSLFKGKVFGAWLVITVMINASLHFMGKK